MSDDTTTRIFYLEVTNNDLITITEEKYVRRKFFCLQDPEKDEDTFLTFDSMDAALFYMFENIKTEFVEEFWLKHYSTKPYGQKKYFKNLG